jgi:hypothetical protein
MGKLTTLRWLALTGGLVALLAMGYAPTPISVNPDGRATVDPSVLAASHRYGEVREALIKRRWANVLADSLRNTANARDSLIVDARFRPEQVALVRSNYAATLSSLGPHVLPVRIFARLTYAASPAGPVRAPTFHVLDATARGGACSTVREVVIPRRPLIDIAAATALLDSFPRPSILGLCGFVATFGPPSSSMRRLLAARGFHWGALGLGAAPWAGDIEALRDQEARWRTSAIYGDVADSRVAANFLSCTRQLGAPCDSLLALREPNQYLPADSATLIRRTPDSFRDARGAVESRLLAQLRHDMGDAQFAQLWRDPRDVPAAYRAITGRPMGEWLHGYLATSMRPERDSGPLSTADLGVAAVIVLASLLLAPIAARSWRPWS